MRNKKIIASLWKCLRVVLGMMSIGLVAACTPIWQSAIDTTKAAFSDPDVLIRQAKPDPRYRFMRFEVNGHPMLLPLAVVDAEANGSIEIWVGADPVMIKLQNGRYFGSKGLETDWQDVRVDRLPDWGHMQHTQIYSRVRQQTPGSEFGIHETVQVSVMHEVPTIAPASLKAMGIDGKEDSIRWFSEKVIAEDGINLPAGQTKLLGYYAVSMTPKPEIVFGYQCLKEDYCISWQNWPSPWFR